MLYFWKAGGSGMSNIYDIPHVSIPFNSAPAHSTRPHNAKKALYVIISGEIPELGEKSYMYNVQCTLYIVHAYFYM